MMSFIPTNIKHKAKKMLINLGVKKIKKRKSLILTSGEQGVNLFGYSRAEMGLGESCRLAANSLHHANIPFVIINFTGTNSARMSDLTWVDKEANQPVYNINVFHVNAEQIPDLRLVYDPSFFDNKYNIGFWHWELEDFPEEWVESFKYLDEVWVPSTFVADAIALKSPVPVIKIPHSIEVKIEKLQSRQYFNLPEKTFLFLTMFDVNSSTERKNPSASIKAFRLAFAANDVSVGLVIKVNGIQGRPDELEGLMEFVQGYGNIYIIKETLSRNDMNSLMLVSDCFISLHRSEGFGLGFAEAMYLGKPVIGTNWSSNTDFMNIYNSCLVRYTLVNLEQNYGPYKKGQRWAEPDIEEASRYMIRLVKEPMYYRDISFNAKRFIEKNYSPSVVGDKIRKRLEYIHYWKFGG